MTRVPKVLIIDDDPGVVHTLSRLVENMGLSVDSALTLKQGLDKVFSDTLDIVLLDVRLPDGNGLEAVDVIMGLDDPPQTIIMTAFSDPEGAALAIESGAWDYIQKPASPKNVELQILRALEYQEQKKRSRTVLEFHCDQIIGSSRAIRACLTHSAQIANADGNVLITGETGTGKELFAKAIHDNSARRNSSFIVVDCSVLTDNLIESVLFGHEKGAFTGADQRRNGLAKLANGGTLFLDEVGELPESIQSAFLRMLQEKKFRPVGSDKEIRSDFRVIAATNQDLDRMVTEGRFRSDLLFRLKSLTLKLPPLRERRGDIVDIARHHMETCCRHNSLPAKAFSDDFTAILEKYQWPGNVRELSNTMEAGIAAASLEEILFAYHLPQEIRAKVARQSILGEGPVEPEAGIPVRPDRAAGGSPGEAPGLTPGSQPAFSAGETLKEVMEKTEKAYLESLYAQVNGDIRQLCRRSGTSRAVLYRKLKKYRIR